MDRSAVLLPILRSALRLGAVLAGLCLVPPTAAAEELRAGGSVTRLDSARTIRPAASEERLSAQASATQNASPSRVRPPEACSMSYHGALKRIEATEFRALDAARKGALSGDPGLPGVRLIPPRIGTRSKAEMAALATAQSLAKSRGRAGAASDSDASWLANRLRVDLSDYLGQGPAPFLCGGVPAYVETLRRFADRIDPGIQQRQNRRLTQVEATRRSVLAALMAMKTVPRPRVAPTDRLSPSADGVVTGGIAGLRPAAGLSRSDAVASPAPDAGRAADLPPLAQEPPLVLETVPDLVAAIDRLLSSVETKGFLTQAPNAMAIGAPAGLLPVGYPVLSRIAMARAYVSGPRPLVGDAKVRFALAAALSDIEALDYLMRAEAEPGDPMGAAIHATLDAILAAHAAECTCRP